MVTRSSASRPIQKAFLNYKNEAVVSCPHCYRTHNAFATALDEHTNDIIQVDCPCGFEFGIELDSRRSYRKKVHVTGMCLNLDSGKSWEIAMVDMSISGVGMKVEQQTDLCVGQRIEIKFDINHEKHTHISKTAVVKRLDNQFIGAEFTDIDAHFEILADYIHATEFQ